MSERSGPAGAAAARVRLAGASALLLAGLAGASIALAQDAQKQAAPPDIAAGGGSGPGELIQVPVTQLFPGGVSTRPTVRDPVADDPDAPQRGMEYFTQMNCVGCHAPNGAGGMGPALSNKKFIYGSEPENIYLSIAQGRPNGMPAWGGMLPEEVIWDLVAYVRSISEDPAATWGMTTSPTGFTIEQAPSEFVSTTTPWRYTTPFSYGQKPTAKPKGEPPPAETQ